MWESTIVLNSIDKVKSFNAALTPIDCEVDLGEGRYVIDGRSIMGIFSLDLSKPLKITVHPENEKALEQAKELVSKYQ